MIRALVAMADELPPTPDGRDWWQFAQQVLVFLIGLATLYGLVIRPTVRGITKHFREAIAEVVAAQTTTNDTLQRVDHQLHPNGGKSAHDYARKAYEEAQAIRAEQRHHTGRLDHLQGELTAQGWRLQEVASEQSRQASVLSLHGIPIEKETPA